MARSVDSSRCSHGDADCSDCTIRSAAVLEAGREADEEDDDDDAWAEEDGVAEDEEDEVAEAVAEDDGADGAAIASGGGTGSI